MKYSDYDENIKKEIYKKYKHIAGIDEVGRGPLAGPVVCCAVIMKKSSNIKGVTDSKKLSKKKMALLKDEIIKDCLAVSYGYANSMEIDRINIKNATHKAMKDALEGLDISPNIVLIDAERIDTKLPQLAIVKGDLKEYAISCASILAKLRRDEIMIRFSKIYPGYSFETNFGYGTKAHYAGLEKYGETPIHRKTFLRKFYERQLSFL